MLIRARFIKQPAVRFISHLDVVRVFDRSLRRANIPVAFSKGFNPHPKITFAHPLPVGVTSDSEFFDLELTEDMSTEEIQKRLNRNLPEGFCILEVREIRDGAQPLMSVINTGIYNVEIDMDKEIREETIKTIIDKFLDAECVIVRKEKHKGGKVFLKDINIRPLISSIKFLSLKDRILLVEMELSIGNSGNATPKMVLEGMKEWNEDLKDWKVNSIHRKGLFIKRNGKLFSPFD